MNIGESLHGKASSYHRQGLDKVRAAVRFALAGRDSRTPALGEVAELTLALSGRDLRARLYTPLDAASPGPLLIYFHGGGFVLGDLDTHDALCRRLAAGGGFRVLSVDYRLAPEHPYPAQIEDAFDSVEWVFAHAGQLGADPGKIGIGGDSAGGYLALAASLHLPGRFAAQLLIYPLLHIDDNVWAESLFKDARLVGRLAVQYIRAQLSAAGQGVPSLRQSATASTPPTFMVTGGALDPVRPDCAAYAKALQAAGVACVFQEHATQPHSFLNLTHVLEPACTAIANIAALVGDALRRPAA